MTKKRFRKLMRAWYTKAYVSYPKNWQKGDISKAYRTIDTIHINPSFSYKNVWDVLNSKDGNYIKVKGEN